MKKMKRILTTLLLIFIYKGTAQNNTIDTLLWENGNYSVVSELGPVWITQKKGPTLKKVKINAIDTASGKIEYYFEGTYHDVLITNIESITPGKFYNQALFFRNKNTPVIVRVPADNQYEIKSDFIAHPSLRTQTLPKDDMAEVKEAEPEQNETNSSIIFPDGKKFAIKLLAINTENVSYKRLDLLNGPTYILDLSIPGSTKRAKVNTVNGHVIIDYRY
jgi:hypothetical protein